jgi:hypothetical protein
MDVHGLAKLTNCIGCTPHQHAQHWQHSIGTDSIDTGGCNGSRATQSGDCCRPVCPWCTLHQGCSIKAVAGLQTCMQCARAGVWDGYRSVSAAAAAVVLAAAAPHRMGRFLYMVVCQLCATSFTVRAEADRVCATVGMPNGTNHAATWVPWSSGQKELPAAQQAVPEPSTDCAHPIGSSELSRRPAQKHASWTSCWCCRRRWWCPAGHANLTESLKANM